MTKAFLYVLVFGVACGGSMGGKCASSYDGQWVGNAGDSLTLSDTCVFSYSGVGGCQSAGTYAAPLGSSGTLQVSIASSTGGNCLPAGNYVCAYSATGSSFSDDCGGGVLTYHR